LKCVLLQERKGDELMIKWPAWGIGLAFGRQFILLMLGLFVFSCGVMLIVKAGLGLAAWDVLHKGLSMDTPLSFGQATQATGLLMIVAAFFLGMKPGLGTLCNMFFIGLWIDVLNNSGIVPEAAPVGGLAAEMTWLVGGLLVIGLGSGMYIKAGLGAGPRDSFMLGLVRRTGWRIAICRAVIEMTACGIGWLLGGPVGIGTLIVAFGLGPSVELGFKICRVKIAHFPDKTPAVIEPARV
jgi:uncharacterized protein